MWTSHTGHFLEVFRDIGTQYNATNPAVPVEIVSVPGSETEITKLATSIRGDAAPDIYFLDRFTIAERAAAGMLEDITPYVNRLDPNLRSKYVDFSWQETQFKGKTYGLPLDTDVRAIFSNSVVPYGLSRIPWKGRDLLFCLVVATMFIPFPVTMIALPNKKTARIYPDGQEIIPYKRSGRINNRRR